MNELNIPEQFKQIMNYEIIKIDRRRWKSFFSAFEQAVKAKQHYVSVCVDGVVGLKSSSNILIKHSDMKFLNETLQSCGRTFGGRILASKADGLTLKNFYDHCDDKGATVSTVKRKNGVIFVSFLPFSWETHKRKWVDAPEAWLFDVQGQCRQRLLLIECGEVDALLK